MPVTLVQLAEHLGLSKSTVSRAIKGHKQVAASTRERVLKAVEELDYRPDPYVSKVMEQRRKRISVSCHGVLAAIHVSPNRSEDWPHAYDYQRYLQGMQKQSKEQGYQIDCFCGDGSIPFYRQIFNQFKARGIEGVIFVHLTHHGVSHIPLSTDFFAGVYIGGGSHLPDLHRIDVDHRENVFLAWKKIREKGHERIGMVSNRFLAKRLKGAREEAFVYCQRELNAERQIPVAEMDPPVVPEKVVAWARNNTLDALILGGENVALEFKRLCPEISVYCLDVANKDSGLPGIDAQHEALGTTAVEVLIAQINRGELGVPKHPQCIYVKGLWVG